jgi:DNA modification methylase
MNRVIFGDCRDTMRDLIADGVRVQMCVTSPPYFGLRDYGHPGQLGLEATPAEFVAAMVEVFGLVRELLADDGVLWLNLGDSYNAAGRTGHGTRQGFKQGTNRASDTGADNCRPSVDSLKPKDLIGIPWRVAFALQEAGWYLRQDIIWHKPNPMPESVTDRCTKAHEYMFLLSKSERYFFDSDAIKEQSVTDDIRRPYGSKGAWDLDGRPEEQRPNGKPRGKGGKNAFRGQGHFRSADTGPANREGRDMADVGAGETRNRRSVWTVPTQPYNGAHFATFPPALIEPCILAGSRPGDTVLDCFFGSGTTGEVAGNFGRQWIGCELNPDYAPLQRARTAQAGLAL